MKILSMLFGWVLAGSLSGCSTVSTTQTRTDKQENGARKTVQVFIIAGQSNAQGYNHVRDYRGGKETFPEHLRVQPAIQFWPGVDPLEPGTNLWTQLQVPPSGAFGPEITFAHQLTQTIPSSEIAIIKYAVGGTGIARSADYNDYIPSLANYNDHSRNWHWPEPERKAGILYEALLQNVASALSALDQQGKKWELAGFVWMQGEHEGGISPSMAKDYAELLSTFILSIRKDLKAPHLPFVIDEVNSHTWAFGDAVRQSQRQAIQKTSRTTLVKTTDLPRDFGPGGPAHFNADGMHELGIRFADAMLPFLKEDSPSK